MIFLMIKPPYINGAHDQDRTGDLILTKDVLYRLSYVGWLSLFKSTAFSPKPQPASRPIVTWRIGCAPLESQQRLLPNKLERETGFEPATLSLEG